MSIRKLKFLILLLFFPSLLFSQIEEVERLYKNATVACFFSASKLNSYYDLQYAESILDSTKFAFSRLEKTHPKYDTLSENINALEKELNISKEIATDNLNYIFPSFSLLAGHRVDYNFIDDTEELLLEDLLQSFLNQADPIHKGNLSTTSHFIIFEVEPFSMMHVGVLLDYISLNTSHYAIRPHEFKSILGKDGYERYVSNALLTEDYSKILNYYGTDNLLTISLSENGSFNSIFYKGITLNVINKTNLKKVFYKYTEQFKVDKSDAFNTAFKSLIFLFLALIFIYFIMFSGYLKYDSRKRVLITSSKNLLRELKSFDHLLLLGSAIIAICTFSQLSKNIRPEINAFKGDLLSMLWPIGQVVTPMLMIFFIGFIIRYKFSRSTTSSPESLTRLIFISLSCPYLYLEYHDSLSQSTITDFYNYLGYFVILFLLIMPSITLGKLLSDLFKKNYQKKLLIFVESLNIIILILVQYFVLAGNTTNSLIFLVLSNLISLYYFRVRENEKNLTKITKKRIVDFDITPNFISNGTNADIVIGDINKFINDIEKNTFILSGKQGSGKTRLLSQYFNSKDNIQLFKGSFDNQKDIYDKSFGVFKHIFIDSNSNLNLPKNFFNRNTAAVKGISNVFKAVSKVAQIDVSQVLDIEGNTTNLLDLSSDLLEELAKHGEKTNKKQIVIFEDYHFIENDVNNKDFVNALMKSYSKRIFFQKHIKFIFSYRSEKNIKGEPFNTYLEELTSLTKVIKSELIITNPKSFITKYCLKTDALIVDDKLSPYLIDKLGSDSFSPLALSVYIKELIDEKYVVIDNNILKLIKSPKDFVSENELFIKKDKILFDTLKDEEIKILVSAANYGEKFNAEVLSHIWNLDLIHVIDILERIEDIGLINDDPINDNFYNFNNVNFFKWLKVSYRKKQNNIEDLKQKEIEFDKRIIDYVFKIGKLNIFSKNEIYSFIQRLEKLGNRVNNYDDKLIKLRFHLANQLFKSPEEKNGEGVLLLNDIFKQIKSNHRNFIPVIISIIKNCITQNGNLKILIDDEEDNTLLETIYDYILANGNKEEKSDINIINLKNLWSQSLYKSQNGHLTFFNKSFDFNDYQSKDQVRVEFYKSLIETQGCISRKQYDELIDLAFRTNNFQLLGEILRDRILRGNLIQKEKKHILDFCLSLETDETPSLNEIHSKKLEDNQVKIKISHIINSKLNSQKASNLSYILSRYLEFYSLKKNHEMVIYLSSFAKDIALYIGDNIGLYNALKYSGHSYYRLEKNNVSVLIYEEYFCKMLEDSEYINIYFRDALEGVLYNCKALNDYSTFDKINQLLKKEAKFLPYSLIYSNPKRSLFNPGKQILSLLPKSNTKANFNDSIISGYYNLTKSILECFIAADKDFDKAELFDLKQIILLLFNKEINSDSMSELISKKIKSIEPGVEFEKSKLFYDFINDGKKLKLIENEYFKKQLFYYCKLLVSSDGNIHPNEQVLLLKLKDFI